MKKPLTLLAAVFILALTLTGCAKTEVPPSPEASVSSPEEPSPSVVDTTPADNPSPSAADPSPEVSRPAWMEAYVVALLAGDTEITDDDFFRVGDASYFTLTDLDLDGVPELLFSYLGTANHVTYAGYTYKDEKVELFRFYEDASGWCPDMLFLYLNTDTGALQWMNHGTFRSGAGHYYSSHGFFDFSDIIHPETAPFLIYHQSLEEEERYFLIDSDGIETETDFETIENAYLSTMETFLYIETQVLTAAADYDNLYGFFEQWDASVLQPEIDDAFYALSAVTVECYYSNTDKPASMLEIYWRQPEIAALRRQMIGYYTENAIETVDEYGIPEGLEYIKTYNLPDISAELVIAGGASECRLFTYKEGTLAPYHDPDVFYEKGAVADEMRIVSTEETPYPMLGIYDYENSTVSVYRITEGKLEYVSKEQLGGSNP